MAAATGPIWALIDKVAIAFRRAYVLARTRAASHPSPIVRLMARRDHVHWEMRMLEREADVLRAQRAKLNPYRRPDYAPTQRVEILQIMALRGWSIQETADRFVVHPNTIRA
jgi:hypothetical protein